MKNNLSLNKSLSRRDFIRIGGGGGVALALALGIGGRSNIEVGRSGLQNKIEAYDAKTAEILASFRERHGFEVVFEDYNYESYLQCLEGKALVDGAIVRSAVALPRVNQRQAIEDIENFLYIFPPNFISEKAGLEKLNFVSDYSVLRSQKGGCKVEWNFIGGFNDEEPERINIEFSNFPSVNQSILIHELHHQLDFQAGQFNLEDELWKRSEYRKNNPKSSYASFPKDIEDTFFTRYSMNRTADDRSEIAELLFFRNDYIQWRYQQVSAEARKVLEAKVAKVKDYYKRWSNGRMDDQFWQDLADKKVDKTYWERRAVQDPVHAIAVSGLGIPPLHGVY